MAFIRQPIEEYVHNKREVSKYSTEVREKK